MSPAPGEVPCAVFRPDRSRIVPSFRNTAYPSKSKPGTPPPKADLRVARGPSLFSAARPPPPRESRPPSASGHTTLPPRQHIRCYECGYEYNLTGRMPATTCPKCKVGLDLAGYTVDDDCRHVLKTLGTILITSRGSALSTQLVATEIDLHGKIRKCKAQAFERLVLHPGAEFIQGEIAAPDLRIEAGAEAVFRHALFHRNVEVLGRMQARLYAEGTITLRSGSHFEGELFGPRLVVEDGAGLLAKVTIGPEGAAETARAKERESSLAGASGETVMVAALPQPASGEPGEPAAPAE